MIQSTRISMGLFFKYFLSLTKIDLGQNYISAINKIQHSHCSPFYGFYGYTKIKNSKLFYFSVIADVNFILHYYLI